MGHTEVRSIGQYLSIRNLLLLTVLLLVIGMIWLTTYYHSLVSCEQTGNAWTMGPYPTQVTTQFHFGHVMFDNKTLWVGQSFSNHGEALENIHGTLVFAVPIGAAFIVTYPSNYSDQLPVTCRVFAKNGQ